MTSASPVRIKRAYEDHSPEDGARVLVDRMWPRGLSKAQLGDVVWLKEVAPSASLRKWFGHKPARWAEFRARYLRELRVNPAVHVLREIAAAGPLTLVYSARDTVHNQAVVLAELLRGKPPAGGEDPSRDDGRSRSQRRPASGGRS